MPEELKMELSHIVANGRYENRDEIESLEN